MYRPAGLVTLFRPNWHQPKNLPKLLVAAFVLQQLFFGINYGFFAAVANRRLRALANLGSAINFLLIMTAYAYNLSKLWDWVTGVLFVVHYLCVFLTMRISKYTIYDFLMDLTAIDVKINFDMNSYIGFKTSVFLLSAVCFKVAMSVLICLRIGCFDKGLIFLIMFVIHEMRILLPILLTSVNILIFNVINMRLKFLKEAFQQRGLRTKHIKMIFKALADCLSKIRVSQDTLVVLDFVVNFIKFVAMAWIQFKILKESPDMLLGAIIININTVFLIIQVCLPAVFAEMVAAQIDGIKLSVHERLLIEMDDDNREELLGLLRYVEARPLAQAAWRLVPVDLRLPAALLGVSATYLVVLLQLTHLY